MRCRNLAREETLPIALLRSDPVGCQCRLPLRRNVVSRKPSGLWTPDGEEIEVEHWNQVLVRVVEWLIENGRLSEKEIKKDEMLGYWLPRTRRSLKRPEKLSNGRFVETGLSSQQVLSRAGVFIESSGDPVKFYVRLSG